MSENKDAVVIERITKEINKINNKELNLFFYVIDTKGNPSGSLAYIYEIAYGLKNMGYKVTMIYNDEEFVGVGDWLGKEYAELPHMDASQPGISISPSDILFIPEVYSSVMTSTRNLPCHRVAILESFDRMTEFIPFGATWADLGIFDAITTTESNAQRLKTYFPFINVHVIRPKISNIFTRGEEEKKLIINVVTREQSDVNKIVKPFFWQYPSYSWVAFRDLRGISREVFAEALKESAITIWADDTTDFGYVPLEAMKAGSLVIGKVPAVAPEWMIEEGNLSNAGIWVDNFATLPSILAGVIRTWTMDGIPDSIQKDADVLVSRYTEGQQLSDVKTVIETMINSRKTDFEDTLKELENKIGEKVGE
jgi:hypothetical protein